MPPFRPTGLTPIRSTRLAPIRLTPADAARYARLRRDMLDDAPWAFEASPGDDRALDLDHLARYLADDHRAIFAVAAGADLAASAAVSPGADLPTDAALGVGADLGTRTDLIAAAAVVRGAPPKFAHRATIWGVFVAPPHRGLGLGRAVVAAAIDLARAWTGVDYVDLGVSARSPEARRLYESLGFQAWGRQPETTAHDGQRHDEIFMTLRLR
jgi:ribosomal protein S18 acetylase RimI-like enzyme